MRAGIVACLIALTGIAGCQETQHCAPGLYGSGCQFSLSGQADSGRDGGMDTGVDDAGPDGGTDAFVPDAGPCGEMCGGSTPHCYLGSDGGDAGHAAGCVECLVRADCAQPDAGSIDGGLAGAFICEDFSCVFGCETEADCGGRVCRPDGTCSAYPVYPASQEQCRPCDAEENCGELDCVPMTFDGAAHGRFCLRPVSLTCSQPYTIEVTGTSLAPGAGSDVYCGVNQAATTCEAVRAFGTGTCGDTTCPCTTSADCGAPGLADGRCETLATGPRCTYSCFDDASTCGAARTCTGPTGFCR